MVREQWRCMGRAGGARAPGMRMDEERLDAGGFIPNQSEKPPAPSSGGEWWSAPPKRQQQRLWWEQAPGCEYLQSRTTSTAATGHWRRSWPGWCRTGPGVWSPAPGRSSSSRRESPPWRTDRGGARGGGEAAAPGKCEEEEEGEGGRMEEGGWMEEEEEEEDPVMQTHSHNLMMTRLSHRKIHIKVKIIHTRK